MVVARKSNQTKTQNVHSSQLLDCLTARDTRRTLLVQQLFDFSLGSVRTLASGTAEESEASSRGLDHVQLGLLHILIIRRDDRRRAEWTNGTVQCEIVDEQGQAVGQDGRNDVVTVCILVILGLFAGSIHNLSTIRRISSDNHACLSINAENTTVRAGDQHFGCLGLSDSNYYTISALDTNGRSKVVKSSH